VLGAALLAGAAALLVVGAELFVANAAGAARRLGTSVVAVGILLAGAEPEELLTAVIAALRDRPGLAAGDAIGANVTMLTACLGLAAVIRPLPLGRRVREYAVLASACGALAALLLVDGRVGRQEGVLLVVVYGALVAVVWWREKQPPAVGELAEMTDPGAAGRRPAVALLLALAGVGLMLVGGDVAVRGAVRVVAALDRADTAVGLTLLALATTAELFALVLAAARHDIPEIAVAGVVGSALYNATVTLGAAAVARPLVMVGGILPAAVAAAALPLVLAAFAGRAGRLHRPAGLALVAGYAAYVVTVLG